MQRVGAKAGPTRRAATVAHGLRDLSSHAFHTATHQRAGPVLAQASLPAGSAILLPPNHTDRAVPEKRFRQQLRLAIAGAGAVILTFLCAAVVAVCLFKNDLMVVITVWCAIESAFWVWMRRHAARLNAQPQPHKPQHNDPILHFKRLAAHAAFYRDQCGAAINWRSYVSKWFKNVPAETVRMENLKEMIGYGFFYSTRDELKADGRWRLVEEMAAQLRELSSPPTTQPPQPSVRLTGSVHDKCAAPATAPAAVAQDGSSVSADTATRQGPAMASGCIRLEDGFQHGLSYMAHLWEPLRWHHRPLAFYLFIEALHCVTWGALTALGFRYIRVQDTTFYYRPGTRRGVQTAAKVMGKEAAKVMGLEGSSPLLLLHGVGLGLLPYLMILTRLSASGLPLLMYEARHVSMRLCLHVPTACEMADRVVAAMDLLGVQQACIAAHSYGTFVASRLVQKHTARAVRSLALVDPVCFGMFLPALLHNFVYRTPWDVYRQSGLRQALRSLLIYFVSRDVHAATTFCRKFFWTDVNLWAEELPPRSLIVLAGADELLHADEVRLVVSGAYVGVPRESRPLNPERLYEHVREPQQRALDHQKAAANAATPFGAVPPPARVLYHPTAGHADWLLDTSWQAEVVEQVLSLALGEEVLHHVARRATAQPYATALAPACLNLALDFASPADVATTTAPALDVGPGDLRACCDSRLNQEPAPPSSCLSDRDAATCATPPPSSSAFATKSPSTLLHGGALRPPIYVQRAHTTSMTALCALPAEVAPVRASVPGAATVGVWPAMIREQESGDTGETEEEAAALRGVALELRQMMCTGSLVKAQAQFPTATSKFCS